MLLAIFIGLTLIITGFQGLTSILGMGFSFLIIFLFILPRISAGENPITIAIAGSTIIIPITFYLSHGFNSKTTTAIFGTITSLVITGVLASYFIETSRLTGIVSDEVSYLLVEKGNNFNVKGLLLAGIIIGVLGILDDITISQAAIVYELKKANSKLRGFSLYKKAMNVGRDHIASLVNTLILVYTGAFLPLMLLFINNPRPFSEVINYEIIAEEIIRTLVTSIGLVLAVPITTLLAVLIIERKS